MGGLKTHIDRYDVFAVSVDSSIRVKREPYFFKYKGLECRYRTSANQQDTDSIACKVNISGPYQVKDVFPILAELISGISFYHDAPMELSPGLQTGPLTGDWDKVNISYRERKHVPVVESMDEFLFIPDVSSAELSTLLRLYRRARASSDIFLETLFYWHTLTFPNKSETPTVKYIDTVVSAMPERLRYLTADIDHLKNNPILSKNAMKISFGHYMKKAVKNGLSHIVRETANDLSIEIDSPEHRGHISMAARILREICRYRIYEDHKLTINRTKNFVTLNYPKGSQ